MCGLQMAQVGYGVSNCAYSILGRIHVRKLLTGAHTQGGDWDVSPGEATGVADSPLESTGKCGPGTHTDTHTQCVQTGVGPEEYTIWLTGDTVGCADGPWHPETPHFHHCQENAVCVYFKLVGSYGVYLQGGTPLGRVKTPQSSSSWPHP